MSKENSNDFENLVDELMKKTPDDKLVRALTKKLGLTYSSDLVTQMNIVLQASDQYTKNIKPAKTARIER